MTTIGVDRDEHGVVTVTLDRPEKRNALDRAMFEGLIDICEDIDARRDDRVVVLTGAGTAFSSGADLTATSSRRSDDADSPSGPSAALGSSVGSSLRLMRLVSRCALTLHNLGTPTIAAVNGPAVGAGCNLALCCDLVVASTTATFGEIFVSRGLTLDFAGSWLLPRRVGLHRAKELALLGDAIDAAEALELGLVNRVVPSADLGAEAHALARRIAARSPLALSIIKQQLNQSIGPPLAAALPLEELAQALSINTRDAREAMAALRQRRGPEFLGE